MKAIKILLAIVAGTFLLTGCSKDDDTACLLVQYKPDIYAGANIAIYTNEPGDDIATSQPIYTTELTDITDEFTVELAPGNYIFAYYKTKPSPSSHDTGFQIHPGKVTVVRMFGDVLVYYR